MSEPTRYKAQIEYCMIGGWLGNERCPDCQGHAIKVETPEWAEWNRERQAAEHIRTQRKPYTRSAPPEDRQCAAIKQNGKRCTKWSRRDDELCNAHFESRKLILTKSDEDAARAEYEGQFK